MRRRLVVGTWALAAALLATAVPAFGHGEPSRHDIAVTLDARAPAMRGVTVAVHRTVAYQLVVENSSQQWLEVVGSSGTPFLRIGPGGVEADLASPEWYRSYTAVGVPVPARARDEGAAPRWTKVSRTPAWGWFDLPIRTEHVRVPHDVLHAGRAATIGHWTVPVRMGGAPAQLTGTFDYAPPPAGYFTARLLGGSEVIPGVRLQILPGSRPGLYLENTSARPVTVLGAGGEPFLTVGPEGVLANVLSPSWLATGQAEAPATAITVDALAPPRWQQRSPSPRFSWIEPRLRSPRESPAAFRKTAGRQDAHRWEITLLHGEEPTRVIGVTEWVPTAAPSRRSPREDARATTIR